MMATGDSAALDEQSSSTDEIVIRQQAARRAWICAGAGFALVGQPAWAIATFVTSLCFLFSLVWLSFQPAAAALWTTLVVLTVAAVLWLAELTAVKRTALREPSPPILVRGFIATSCVVWLTLAGVLGLFVTSFGSLQMAGSGMKPTLERGERLVYYKHVDWPSVKPDAIIVYKNASDSAWGEPGWLVVSRILAGPGDKLSIQGSRYHVNGTAGPPVADTGQYDVALDIPLAPESLTIPNGRYFIVQDSPTGGFDSRVLSFVPAENVIGTQLWYVSRRGIGKPVE